MKYSKLIILFSILILQFSMANVINVPADQPTIQAGLNVAGEGDTVLVSAGTYVENIIWPTINGIKLIGIGEETCIIDGDSLASVIRFEEDLDVIIDTATLITGFTIQNGYAQGEYPNNSGGGIYFYSSSPSLENVTITNNSVSVHGGGIFCQENSNPSLNNVTIMDNMALDGGGIDCVDSNPSLENITISGNLASFRAGGIMCHSSNPNLENVTIINNTSSSYSGGIACMNSSPILRNVTIANNSSSLIGGIYCRSNSSPILINCILWNNSPQEIYFLDWDNPNSIIIAYSDIQGGEEGIVTNDNGTVYWEEGNIDTDPLFFDAENGDYHLTENSPCIDAGTAFFIWEGDTLVNMNEDEYNGNAPDMGAFESEGEQQTPQISISPDSLNFTVFPPENEQTQTLTISNTGNAPLEVQISTAETVTDIDGNVYQTVQIGDQLWMAENLKVTHYRNGDAIPTGYSNSEWVNLSTGAYCVYDDNETNADIYGYLYNWFAVDDSRNIAPEGWHVPMDGEWQTLVDYLGGGGMAGGKMKATGTIEGGDGLWYEPNTGATNESGFTALPGGYRDTYYGSDYNMGIYGSFWSSTEAISNYAWDRLLYYNYSGVYRNYYNKLYGFSVRCIRDLDPMESTVGGTPEELFHRVDYLTIYPDKVGIENIEESTFQRGKTEPLKGTSTRNNWLTVNPTTLTIQPNSSEDIDVTIDALILEIGEYLADIIISSNDPDEPVLIVPVTLVVDTISSTVIEIDFIAGWNIFSSYVTPDDLDMLSVVQPLIDADELDIVFDESGNSIVYFMGTWLNNIGDFASTEGYYIKISDDADLTIEGTLVNLPFEISLSAGWSIMGYPTETAQDALDVVQPLIDTYELERVIDETGNAIVYFFNYWINNIGDFEAGEGYYIKVNTTTSLTITTPALVRAETSPDEDVSKVTLPAHFMPVYYGNPFMPMGVYLVGEEFTSLDLDSGDEGAVFDGELCVGATVVDGEISITNPLIIITSMDDEIGMPGFSEGNPISYRIWDASKNRELFISEVTNYNIATGNELNTKPTFERLGTIAVSFKSYAGGGFETMLPETFALHQNYPNPFNPVTTIRYELPEESHVSIVVYDIMGRQVKELVSGELVSGYHTAIWDATDSFGKPVGAGIYLYQIKAGDFTQTRKMILLK